MKKQFLSLLVLFFSFSSFAQIATREMKVSEKSKYTELNVYDGSVNFLEDNIKLYIGEVLYLNGVAQSLRKYGYENFTKDYKKFNELESSLKPIKYDLLAEKYFIVEDVFDYTIKGGNLTFLKLRERDTKNIWYFRYEKKYEHKFPFIAVKYFDFLKRELCGKKFVVRGKNWISAKEKMKDLNTGEEVKEFVPGAIWTCVDIAVEKRFYQLSMILQNSMGQEIPLDVDRIKANYFVLTEEDAKILEKKYGKEVFLLVLGGKVRVGLNKEECEFSWGKPIRINETITEYGVNEQWVYPDNYLYFDNGVLKAIQ